MMIAMMKTDVILLRRDRKRAGLLGRQGYNPLDELYDSVALAAMCSITGWQMAMGHWACCKVTVLSIYLMFTIACMGQSPRFLIVSFWLHRVSSVGPRSAS